MTKFSMEAALAAGALALLFSAAPVKVDAKTGGLQMNSAEARVFKGGSSQRVGSVNPADPGRVTTPTPNTKGGGKGGSGGGKGK